MNEFVFELNKNLNLESIDLANSEKAQGLVTLEKHSARNSKVFFIHPKLYNFKNNLPETFFNEVSEALKNILETHPSAALRTCFVLDRFKSSEGLPSWRSLTSINEIILHLKNAYKTGEEVSNYLSVPKPEYGLILMSFPNPKKGGLAIVSKDECMIHACFGDNVTCTRNQAKDIDTFFVNKNFEITKKMINLKRYMVEFNGPEETQKKLPAEMQTQQVLTDKEIRYIAQKSFEISEDAGDSIFEFLVGSKDEVIFHGMHPHKS